MKHGQRKVWLDTAGNPIQAHGGGILHHNGTYYWYGEIKDSETTVTPSYPVWNNGHVHMLYQTLLSGVSCYSSRDLVNWEYHGKAISANMEDPAHDLYYRRVLERPKVIYNEKTKKFVMWFHCESQDYQYARAGVAISDTPEGPFEYIESFRPVGDSTCRDQTVFVDDDGTAYHMFAGDSNATTYISKLTDDYLKPSGEYTRQFIDDYREAHAVFKRNGQYYALTSGCTGWDPNQAEIGVASSMLGDWERQGNPCIGEEGEQITWNCQSTYVFYHEESEQYIAMFDCWKKENLLESGYLWLPVTFDGEIAKIKYHDYWSEDLLSVCTS